jgi:hypothetical protein
MFFYDVPYRSYFVSKFGSIVRQWELWRRGKGKKGRKRKERRCVTTMFACALASRLEHLVMFLWESVVKIAYGIMAMIIYAI